MKVKFLKLHPDAEIPKKKYYKDFCYDVKAVREEEIAPNVWKYYLGFALQAENHVYNPRVRIDFDIRPRSSVWEHGMVLSNCECTIDEGFTGEISMIFYHVFPNMPRYSVGDRIGQLKIGRTEDLEFVEVEELDETDRNANGFGSTGLR